MNSAILLRLNAHNLNKPTCKTRKTLSLHYITDICYLACRHKVKLEAAFINAALACEIMEGLAASLYPDMHVQQVALPMVLKAEVMHGLKGMPAARLWMK
eukprot:CCRYP_006461-RA/>CCRYP_006461-RA protein AED:0.63 eAED:0.53 QI:0/0/0/0.5/0/0/2/0/99